MPMSIPKRSKFRHVHKNQVNFDHPHKKEDKFDPNTDISIPSLKLRPVRHPRKNQVNSDPWTEIASISIPHTELKFIGTIC